MLRDDGSKIGIARAQIRAASATTARLRREPDRDDRERTGEKHIQDNRVTTHRSPSFELSVERGRLSADAADGGRARKPNRVPRPGRDVDD